jgi:hypothetical protein
MTQIRYSVRLNNWDPDFWFDNFEEVTDFMNQSFENEAVEIKVKIHGY